MFISKKELEDIKSKLDSLFIFKRTTEDNLTRFADHINVMWLEKSTQKPVIAKKRGRPVGSKANRPKFPPKTPFELKKPLGRPKGSKNKAK